MDEIPTIVPPTTLRGDGTVKIVERSVSEDSEQVASKVDDGSITKSAKEVFVRVDEKEVGHIVMMKVVMVVAGYIEVMVDVAAVVGSMVEVAVCIVVVVEEEVGVTSVGKMGICKGM
ncbi:hypothetical protein RDI58_003916 [Solanum bulbocastanum]|uniref:Uncharacterized protein n=1 Tax=Solanum bulbocastanum TaxID=147425 RepID=A0AAN8TY07_SOLBU